MENKTGVGSYVLKGRGFQRIKKFRALRQVLLEVHVRNTERVSRE